MLRDTSYATSMDLTPSEGLNYLLLARLVERTADHADRITQQSLAFERTKAMEPFLQKLEKQGRKATELFQSAMRAFAKPDAAKAHQIIEDANRFADSQEKLLEEAAGLKSAALAHLAFVVESIGRTAAYAADVGEVTINHVVGQADRVRKP
jgi:phosphate uptake regulator